MNRRVLLRRLIGGHLHNVKFSDFTHLVEGFGFKLERSTGSHCVYFHPSVEDGLNLQPFKGEVKPYQIKQFLVLIEENKLKLEERD